MTTESDIQELRGAFGDLAHAVEELADAVKQGPFSDTATMRVAVSVSKTARNIASQLAGQGLVMLEPDSAEPRDSAAFAAVAVPEDVVALARAGKTLEAVKQYRAVSGATLEEAQAVLRDIT
jgi:ribosomal protein L7/L12